jgi:NADH:ubiquinone oxidoreductase subunit K
LSPRGPVVAATAAFITAIGFIGWFAGFYYFQLLETTLDVFSSFRIVTSSEIPFNFGIFLTFSGIIFSIGAFGIAFNRKNVLLLMVSVEIMFLGINLAFISGYIFLNLEVGLVYALVNLSIAAAEAA